MKKAVALLLCVLSLLLLWSCEKPSESDEAIPTDSVISEETDSKPIVVDDSYKKIACETPSALQQVVLSFHQSLTTFSIPMPQDWQLSENSNRTYRISRGMREIGIITPNEGAALTKDGERVFHQSEAEQNGIVIHSIYRYMTNGEKSFRRHIVFRFNDPKGTPRTVSLNVDYAALDERTVNGMLHSITSDANITDPHFNFVNLNTAKAPKILILGNSFVRTSDIGYILRSMAGDEIDVTDISVGMATVTKYATYAEHEHIRSDLKNGTYDAVFLCGFYGSGDVTNFKIIQELCQAGGTKLIVFPAHNEGTDLILSLSPSTKVLDWQGEINYFINHMGVDYYDMCMNDDHDHSKPLAGYVGAHMIYRAVIGKVPPTRDWYGIDHTYVLSRLGQQYVSTGTFSKAPNNSDSISILYF